MVQRTKLRRGIISLLAVCVFCGCGFAAAENPAVKITDLGDKLKIEVSGKLFTEYVYKNCAQPHFYPLIGPTGEIIVRRWPTEEGLDGEYEQHDHPHHVGLWFGHMVNGNVNFWARGKVHEKFLKTASGDVGVIKEEIKWVSEANEAIATSINTYKIYSKPQGQMLDYEMSIHAGNKPMVFNDSKEGSMAIRLATSMALNLNSKALGNPNFRFQRKPGEQGGHIINSEGVTDANTLGKKAAWCDYYGPLKGQIVGVAIFDNPKNVGHPTCWMARDYGLFAANPFGISDINRNKGEKAGEVTIPAGGNLDLKYRFYFHKGDEKQGKVAEMYKEYLAECAKDPAEVCSAAANRRK